MVHNLQEKKKMQRVEDKTRDSKNMQKVEHQIRDFSFQEQTFFLFRSFINANLDVETDA